MSQSRDEIAEHVVALAGSVSNEKAARMRELVSEARKAGPLKSTAGSDGAHLGQSPGGELPVERRATSGPVVPLEERGRVDEPFEPWARRQIEKLAAILLPLESSMSKMRERVYEIVREEIALVRGGEDPHAETKRTGEGREVDARGHSNVAEPTATQPDNSRPAGNASSAVVDEGSAASRQAAPSPDPIPAWMLSAEEIADLAPVEHPTGTAAWWRYFSVALRTSIARRAPKLPTPEEVAAPIRAALEASRAPSPSLVEAADAMRTWTDNFLAGVKAKNGLFVSGPGHTQALNKMLRAVEAYDAARHAEGAQPDSACDEIGWLVEITGPRYWTGTPGCGNWTADSRAAMRFARRQDAEAACRHLAPSGAIPVEHAWVSHRPAGAQPSGPDRCEVCDWPLAESRDKGCVPGDCSYRPEEGSPEWYRIRARREALKAQPSGAPDGLWRCENCGDAYDALDARWRMAATPEHACGRIPQEGHYPARWFGPKQPSGAPAPASAQGEVCECGHRRAMHFDEDGDHNGACLYQMNDKPFCRCDMFRAKDKERA